MQDLNDPVKYRLVTDFLGVSSIDFYCLVSNFGIVSNRSDDYCSNGVGSGNGVISFVLLV